jgi:hypothetical protein
MTLWLCQRTVTTLDASVVDLPLRQAAHVPLAHRDPLRLVDEHTHHLVSQGLEPCLAKLRPAQHLRGEALQFHRVCDLKVVVLV